MGPLQHYVELDEIDAICLSHLHADHCLDMCSYQVFRNYHPGGPLGKVPVYGPRETADRLDRATWSSHGRSIAETFDVRTLSPGKLEIGPFAVTVDHMNHPVETFGFRIEHAGRVITYSADTGPAASLVGLAAGADVLVCEASFADVPGLPADLHLTAGQAGEHAARAGAGRLVLTHLVPWNDPDQSLEQAAASFAGPLELARQGMRLRPTT